MICPICKHESPEPVNDETSYFPFCSDRCKLIDLGRWLSGKYQIPVVEEIEPRDDEVNSVDPSL